MTKINCTIRRENLILFFKALEKMVENRSNPIEISKKKFLEFLKGEVLSAFAKEEIKVPTVQ